MEGDIENTMGTVADLTEGARRLIRNRIMLTSNPKEAAKRLLSLGDPIYQTEIVDVILLQCCRQKAYERYYACVAYEVVKMDDWYLPRIQETVEKLNGAVNSWNKSRVMNLGNLVGDLIAMKILSWYIFPTILPIGVFRETLVEKLIIEIGITTVAEKLRGVGVAGVEEMINI